MRYEQKANLQDSNKARMYEAKKKARIYAAKKNKHNVLIAKMYEEKKKQKIYKCIRLNSNGEKFISYATTVDCYQLDAIEVNKINFKANDMESLCDELNNNETGDVLDE